MSNTSNTILGIFSGAIVGIALGVLYAPDKGVNIRKKIAEGVEEAKDSFEEKASEIKDTVMHEAQNKKETLEDQVETLASNVSYKTEDIINALEKKLADLKKQNKKYQKA